MLARFTSRKFLIALVVALGGLALALWPEQEDQIKTLMQQATDMVGLLIAAISAVAYIMGESKIDAARAGNTGTPPPDPSAAASAASATAVKSLGALLVLGLLLGSAGCASYTPTQKWATARVGLTTATDLLTEAAKTGKLTDQQIVDADKGIQSARAALSAAEAQLPEGAQGFEDYLKIVDAVLERLIQLHLQALTPATPATGPPTPVQ
ncbi:MAG: hypothetical protein IT442_05020 [Phycisphaeraceae bacterium]|nr:hypothetical protein [Phycisphaeraceae bacterium]